MEGNKKIGSSYQGKSTLPEDNYQTARRVLDLDVQYMSSKDYDKFIESSNDDCDFYLDSNAKFVCPVDNDFDNDSNMSDDYIQIEADNEYNAELISALRANNLITLKNSKSISDSISRSKFPV